MEFSDKEWNDYFNYFDLDDIGDYELTDDVYSGEQMEKHLRELFKFEMNTPMTFEERKAIHQWVAAGHSIYEEPMESEYMGDLYGGCSFLDVYRMDREFDRMTESMTIDEVAQFMRHYVGLDEDIPAGEKEMDVLREETPVPVKSRIASMLRENRLLWRFLEDKALDGQAELYIQDHRNDDESYDDGWFKE